MRTITRTQRVAAATLAAVTALALAACSPEDPDDQTAPSSGSDGTSTPATDGGDAATATTQQELVAAGPVADDATIEANEWAKSVKEAGVLSIGGTETSQLFSFLDPTTGETNGFDAGISQLLSNYILGEPNVDILQVTSDTREAVLENDSVDLVIATYSITPARAEKIDFAGPYYSSQAGILVKKDNEDITGLDDLAGKQVATQSGSTGIALLEEEAPDAEILALPDHAAAVAAVKQGTADAYVIDQTLLLNVLASDDGSDLKIVGEPFGPEDLYGIGVSKDSDAVEFINEFLTQIEDDGTWATLWELTIGERTDVSTVPTPPTPGETGL